MIESKKKTILVVDDDRTIRKILTSYLTKAGFDVIEAGDPGDCLKNLAATTPSLDLGLIDFEMPHINGIQLIKMIRKHPYYTDLSFIMVTSRYEKEYIIQALEAGACDYIVKPFEPKAVLQKISKYLK